jgi:hypothetical protein
VVVCSVTLCGPHHLREQALACPISCGARASLAGVDVQQHVARSH